MSLTRSASLEGLGIPRVLGPFVFNHDDAGLNDGIAFYTPTVGDVLLDAWVSVIEAFDGTTPYGDLGTFVGDAVGLFGNNSTEARTSLAIPDEETAGTGVLIGGPDNHNMSLMQQSVYSNGTRFAPAKFTAVNPLKFVASQDGSAGGTAVGGTTGIAHVYIVVASPGVTTGPSLISLLASLTQEAVFGAPVKFAGVGGISVGQLLDNHPTMDARAADISTFRTETYDRTTFDYVEWQRMALLHKFFVGAIGDLLALTINTNGTVQVGASGLVLPTSDPHIAGAWWDNAGTLTKSAG